jgi:hypothetical protein
LKQIHLNLNDDKLCENNDYIDDDLWNFKKYLYYI